MYVQRNTEARSRNHFCHGKTVHIRCVVLCVRACTRAQMGDLARGCVYTRARVTLFIQHATRMRHIMT
jgi:hypothetical protein